MSGCPGYDLRGLSVVAYPDEQWLLEEIFTGGRVRPGTMVAMNAEKIIAAESDPLLRNSIQAADYRYADGVSVVMAVRRKHAVRLTRITGADLWHGLMARAVTERAAVYLLGGRPPVALEVHRKLRHEWNVRVVGSRHGYFADADRDAVMREIRDSGAAIVTVALGSPRQEIFMQECRRLHPALYIGVGGTFDVVSGQVRRAPAVLRRCGLEWCYRILVQPTRLFRVGRLIRFAILHLRNRL
ncbi:WecB/TagA/CpsF family glycosyltransferase [Kineosporia succinea]|uniref:UDP-N-acetyl-D-mannosaminouronate:lipid I N-acetyl-D-mannosaminouronosyltransferase n=1 Tax=Kineosporia succinea TaxID=84632 RepID=A0ABT9PDV6_9ACTN|nr:WecB/TagA/CpsF family glycosyltransferase [Kineosporia succinea]MDP9830579.1 UDP-N-acetyl-D-mannosaminouronate:lipid I N-acetyl-D-mannosaminouronosyltransferase [Kineosporia succinea]